MIRSAASAAAEGVGHVLHVLVLELLEHLAQRPGCRGRAPRRRRRSRLRRGPRRSATRTRGSAARGASGRGRPPAPSRSAAPASTRTADRRGVRWRSSSDWRCASRHLCPIEPAKRRLNPHFSRQAQKTRISGTPPTQFAVIRFAPGAVTMGAMPNVGPLELAIVLIIALVVFGPKRLPELGRSLGKGSASSTARSAARATSRSSPRRSSPAADPSRQGRRGRAGRSRPRLRTATWPA